MKWNFESTSTVSLLLADVFAETITVPWSALTDLLAPDMAGLGKS